MPERLRDDRLRRALLGAWRLRSHLSEDATGTTRAAFLGPRVSGSLIYTPGGFMSATLAAAARAPLSASTLATADDASAADAFRTHLSYAGRFSVVGDRVVHHVEVCSYPNFTGRDLMREADVSGDLLVLAAEPRVTQAGGSIAVATWRRLESISC